VHDRIPLTTGIGSGKEIIPPADRSLRVILLMSYKKLLSIFPGVRFTGAACTDSTANAMLQARPCTFGAVVGELRIGVPLGISWHREAGFGFDPDPRLRQVIRLIFQKRELGCTRQVLLCMRAE
jgi:hypothetical protein